MDNSRNFQYVCTSDEIQLGKSKAFMIKGEGGENVQIAVFHHDNGFFAISDVCIHKGGPLSEGILEGEIIQCPWHGWKYSIVDGRAPHLGGDSVDSYETKIIENSVFVSAAPVHRASRASKPDERYTRLEQSVKEYLKRNKSNSQDRKIRILGISTTNASDKVAPRQSTSENALAHALNFASKQLEAETILIKLRDLYFKDCEGYYSKNARACIFPCTISEREKADQMIEIYEKMILWADVVLVATPIRWGSASSLYYKMVQRLNSVQNQITTHHNQIIRNKVAAFIITGGQDNVQHVAGEMMSFWSQTGFLFAKFPFVGWSRGWYAEDTENNISRMSSHSQFMTDIEGMISNAVALAGLVNRNNYDENLLRAR